MQGILIPIGGNEDKGIGKNEMYTLEFIGKGILANVVKESGGTDAKIVVITTASSIPQEIGQNYMEAFNKLGCRNVIILDIRDREKSEEPEILQIILDSDCVLFSGGDQSKIVDFIGATSLHQLLFKKLEQTHFVLAGTSAGAMCMSKEMIKGGHSSDALFKGGVLMRDGMGFLDDVIIDSHFIQRGRFGRLTEAVATFPHLLGIGLAEDTGLIIRNGNDCEVVGSGMVIIFDPSDLQHNNVAVLKPGLPVSITNLKVNILADGDKYFLDERRVAVMTLEEYDRIQA
ncbi:MAG: cyanophycinase [Chitinophagales bacterium]|nr:cyanophycinase [Saprospirales bacterium]MBP6661043.1 cyanophycinase [Chitinophagales bacterium]